MKIVNSQAPKKNVIRLTMVTFGTAFKLLDIPSTWPGYLQSSAMKRTWVLGNGYYKDDSSLGLIMDLENGIVAGLSFDIEVEILPNATLTIERDE